jgi:transcription elongation factor Elf1
MHGNLLAVVIMGNDDKLTTLKFFANSQNRATIRCPKCGVSKTIDATPLKNTGKRIKVTCKCGEAFRAAVEFRQYYRKSVHLDGRYFDLNSHRRGTLQVVDLSMGGVGFTCDSANQIQPGDHLEVIFNLDDQQQSEIRLKVVVRNIKGKMVGVERTDTQLYQGALGFYLM